MNGMEGEVLGVGCVGNCINCDSHFMFVPDTHSHTIPAQLRWYLCKIYSLAG